jgi:hypothetical protein
MNLVWTLFAYCLSGARNLVIIAALIGRGFTTWLLTQLLNYTVALLEALEFRAQFQLPFYLNAE